MEFLTTDNTYSPEEAFEDPISSSESFDEQFEMVQLPTTSAYAKSIVNRDTKVEIHTSSRKGYIHSVIFNIWGTFSSSNGTDNTHRYQV